MKELSVQFFGCGDTGMGQETLISLTCLLKGSHYWTVLTTRKLLILNEARRAKKAPLSNLGYNLGTVILKSDGAIWGQNSLNRLPGSFSARIC